MNVLSDADLKSSDAKNTIIAIKNIHMLTLDSSFIMPLKSSFKVKYKTNASAIKS